MICQQVYLYFYDELEDNKEFLDHLQNCQACQQQLIFLQKMTKIEKPHIANCEVMRKKIQRTIQHRKSHFTNRHMLIAVAIIIISFSIVILPLNNRQKRTTVTVDYMSVDKDLKRIHYKIKRLSQRKYSKRLYRKSFIKIKNKIAKLKTTNIW